MIPHTRIPLSLIRPKDVVVLLIVGSLSEIVNRLVIGSLKKRSKNEKRLREKLQTLRYETNKKRKLGPSAFVETAKLERRILGGERELNTMMESKKLQITRIESIMKYAYLAINAIIFAVYFGIPLLTIDGIKVSLDNPELVKGLVETDGGDNADGALYAAALMRILFPLSYIGIGVKISRFGLQNKASSVSALMVYWASQTMTEKVYDCIEALAFR